MTKEEKIECFQRLEVLAKSKGMSFYVIADGLDIPNTIFSDWKKGKSMPKADKLVKIAKFLGTTVEFIIEG